MLFLNNQNHDHANCNNGSGDGDPNDGADAILGALVGAVTGLSSLGIGSIGNGGNSGVRIGAGDLGLGTVDRPGVRGEIIHILTAGQLGQNQVIGLGSGVVEDDVGDVYGDLAGIDIALDQSHRSAGPGIGEDVGGRVPGVEVDILPASVVDEVDSTVGGFGFAAGAHALIIEAVADLSGADGAETVGVVGIMGAGIHSVDNSDAGGTDLTGDLASGNGEGVAGDGISVGAVSNGIGGDIHVSFGSLSVDQDYACSAALHIGDAAFLGDILRSTGEGSVELVHSGDLRIRPAGDGSSAQVLGHIGRTGQIQTHGVAAGSHQGPGLIDVLYGNISGVTAVSGEIIVGLSPDYQLIGLSGFVVIGGVGAGVIAADHILQNGAAPDIIGDAHVLGVGTDGQVAAGVIQNLAVAVQVNVTGGLGVIDGTVHHGGPEIAGTVGVIGGFNVLGTVTTEAVGTGIDAFLQEVQNIVLNLLAAGIQVRQAGHAMLGHIVAIIVVGGVLAVIMPAGSIILNVGNDGFSQVVGSGVAHMVGDHIDDDLDALFMGGLAHLLEIGLGAQGTVTTVVNGEGGRLIEGPPVVAGVLLGGLLGGLNGGSLDGSIAQSGDSIQIGGDLIEGPVPAMQGHAVLNGQPGVRSVSLGRNSGEADTGYQHQSQHQAKGAQNLLFHGFSSCIFINPNIIAKNWSIVQYFVKATVMETMAVGATVKDRAKGPGLGYYKI